MKPSFALPIGAALLAAMLAGCGQPGPLYMPRPPAKPAPAASTPASPETPISAGTPVSTTPAPTKQ